MSECPNVRMKLVESVSNDLASLNRAYKELKKYKVTEKSIAELFKKTGWNLSLLSKHGFYSKVLYEGYILRAYVRDGKVTVKMKLSKERAKNFTSLPNFRYLYGLSLGQCEVQDLDFEFRSLLNIKKLSEELDNMTTLSGGRLSQDTHRIIESNGIEFYVRKDDSYFEVSDKDKTKEVLEGLWHERAKK